MDKEIVKAIAAFLDRVDLKGNEVPVFNACLEALKKEFDKVEEKSEEE